MHLCLNTAEKILLATSTLLQVQVQVHGLQVPVQYQVQHDY